MLKGYKTFIVGLLMIVLGVFNDFDTQTILEGLGFIALRLGMKNS